MGVLISGRGSNLSALIAAGQDPDFPARIVLVLSNREDAAGLALARAAGIAARTIAHQPFGADREGHERALDEALRRAGVARVCLAGYMRRLSPLLVRAWEGRMLNIHPSLLPAFPGLRTHERALAAGVKLHGCTVHLVTETVDDGPILGQSAIAVHAYDTPDSLAARVLRQEHVLYPLALRRHLGGGVPAPEERALLSV